MWYVLVHCTVGCGLDTKDLHFNPIKYMELTLSSSSLSFPLGGGRLNSVQFFTAQEQNSASLSPLCMSWHLNSCGQERDCGKGLLPLNLLFYFWPLTESPGILLITHARIQPSTQSINRILNQPAPHPGHPAEPRQHS